ncbi:hypothetical protein RAJCM14343_2108 [Rhodococcus aetherivorans]|uniref:Uncharacterized protein n=2 Tax=Rhodococcus aetherivorans TaxID=191292 RepID=A0ABQ0YK48_9NOCA|nr:hypothetical protein RR21198_2131 [Rhodococcus rhodochrous ATCC 21198]NCL73702.1 hypothetical protein [Rhodococcus sp. YH1]PND49341.1 hypothetical protein CQZ88_25220 [Rhodococcus sp. ENV425]GES36854.1 hypothetical protein RAJCM14343_2108 [Rhodococcus aetherivorans]
MIRRAAGNPVPMAPLPDPTTARHYRIHETPDGHRWVICTHDPSLGIDFGPGPEAESWAREAWADLESPPPQNQYNWRPAPPGLAGSRFGPDRRIPGPRR